MPPRQGHPVGATGYCGITARVYDMFVDYIYVARQRVWLGMFRTEEAACTYDAAVWRFGHARSGLNFPDIETVEEAQFLAPPT
jgi:hypothetical protein